MGTPALSKAEVAVAGIGDVNGDGYDDILVGAQEYGNGEIDEGRAYLFYGSASGPSAAPDWTAESNMPRAAFGWAVGAAGDVNLDGYADFLVGADEYDVDGISKAGRAYLYLGSAAGPAAAADWIDEGTQDNGRFAHAVGSAGDVNGDGFPDIIIGEQRYSNGEYQEERALLYGSYALVQTTTTITYEYDPLYRLTGAVYTGTMNAAYEYVYDAVGNMTAYADTVNNETTSVTRTFDAANRLQTATDSETGTTSYTFDDNGSLAQILPPGVNPGDAGEQLYAYDQRSLLTNNTVGVGGSIYDPVADYVYDGAANRIQQVDFTGPQPVTTTYTNDNTGLSQVLVTNNGITITHNLVGLGLISQDDGATVRTLLSDGLGSGRVEMVGSVIEAVATYEPFGKLLARTGETGTVYGYVGEQFDAASGLVYLRARYYAPYLNQFQSRDPFAGYAKLPQSQNGYSYANNNPVNYTDSSGLCAEVGDEACWSLAERHNIRYGIGLEYFGRLSYKQLYDNPELSAVLAYTLYQNKLVSIGQTKDTNALVEILDYSIETVTGGDITLGLQYASSVFYRSRIGGILIPDYGYYDEAYQPFGDTGFDARFKDSEGNQLEHFISEAYIKAWLYPYPPPYTTAPMPPEGHGIDLSPLIPLVQEVIQCLDPRDAGGFLKNINFTPDLLLGNVAIGFVYDLQTANSPQERIEAYERLQYVLTRPSK